MIYVIHDFIGNLKSALKANDYLLVADLVNDEVAKVIVFDKGRLTDVLLKSGAKKAKSMSYTEVAEYISNNNSDSISTGIAKIIALNAKENNVDKDVLEQIKKNINKGNINLLRNKVNSHLRLKDKVSGFDGDESEMRLKTYRTIRNTVLIYSAMIVAGYFGYKYFFGKKHEEIKPIPNE